MRTAIGAERRRCESGLHGVRRLGFSALGSGMLGFSVLRSATFGFGRQRITDEQRQLDPEPGARAGHIGHADPATVRLHDRRDDGEP